MLGNKIRKILERDPELALGVGYGALGGVNAAVQAGTAHKDPLFMVVLKEKARMKGIKPDTQEWDDFISEGIHSERLKRLVSLGGMSILGGAAITATGRGTEKALRVRGLDRVSTARHRLRIPQHAKTKRQARKEYMAMLTRHHARGGPPEQLKEIERAWNIVEHSPWFQKLSFEQNSILNGFCKQAARVGHAISK
jgi:hypothetical protein